jgi:hypothetical protein
MTLVRCVSAVLTLIPRPTAIFFAAVSALGRVVNCVGKQSGRGLGIEFTEIDADDKKHKGWSMDIDNFRTRSHNFLDHGNGNYDFAGNVVSTNIFFPLTTEDALIRAWELTFRPRGSPRSRPCEHSGTGR